MKDLTDGILADANINLAQAKDDIAVAAKAMLDKLPKDDKAGREQVRDWKKSAAAQASAAAAKQKAEDKAALDAAASPDEREKIRLKQLVDAKKLSQSDYNNAVQGIDEKQAKDTQDTANTALSEFSSNIDKLNRQITDAEIDTADKRRETSVIGGQKSEPQAEYERQVAAAQSLASDKLAAIDIVYNKAIDDLVTNRMNGGDGETYEQGTFEASDVRTQANEAVNNELSATIDRANAQLIASNKEIANEAAKRQDEANKEAYAQTKALVDMSIELNIENIYDTPLRNYMATVHNADREYDETVAQYPSLHQDDNRGEADIRRRQQVDDAAFIYHQARMEARRLGAGIGGEIIDGMNERLSEDGGEMLKKWLTGQKQKVTWQSIGAAMRDSAATSLSGGLVRRVNESLHEAIWGSGIKTPTATPPNAASSAGAAVSGDATPSYTELAQRVSAQGNTPATRPTPYWPVSRPASEFFKDMNNTIFNNAKFVNSQGDFSGKAAAGSGVVVPNVAPNGSSATGQSVQVAGNNPTSMTGQDKTSTASATNPPSDPKLSGSGSTSPDAVTAANAAKKSVMSYAESIAALSEATAFVAALLGKNGKSKTTGEDGLLGMVAGAAAGSAIPGLGILGGMNAGGALGSMFGGLFAEGGLLQPGRFNIVGEAGPEIVLPSAVSRVTSNQELRDALSGRGDGGGNVNVTVTGDHHYHTDADMNTLANKIARKTDTQRRLPQLVTS
jgi:hypothetical protein